MIELVRLRLKGVRLLALITWLGIITIACGMPFAGSGATPLVMAVLLALFPTLAAWQGRTDRPSLMAIGATMPMFSALLLYQWSGHLMQIDLHMSFFAVIAMLAVLADWRPVLAGAATTAVHHLLLNFVAPELVFPNGADLGRVVLHAVIVVVETGVLMVLAMQLESFLLAQARATAEKEDLEHEAERHRAQEEAERQLVVDQIAGGLRGLAQGDLSSAIQTPFPPSFETLRIDFNNSVARLRELANTVSQSSAQIQHGTAEIQVAADDLARRTELQASSIDAPCGP